MTDNINEKIDLFVYDFDGVLTDNMAYVSESGEESVRVNRSDGLAISMIKKMGKRQLILSTEENPVVSKRADKLGIECLQGSKDKKASLKAYCDNHSISLERVLFIGNDVNDQCLLDVVGVSCAPADAYPDYKDHVTIVFKSNGGYGVIRELYSMLIN